MSFSAAAECGRGFVGGTVTTGAGCPGLCVGVRVSGAAGGCGSIICAIGAMVTGCATSTGLTGRATDGDPVVHLQHGIGRYLGLQNLDFGGRATKTVVVGEKVLGILLQRVADALVHCPSCLKEGPHVPLKQPRAELVV